MNKNDSDIDYEKSSESDYEEEEEESEEIQCKNLDPALAKLMGIIIEEQKEIDWKPPQKSGLNNSKEIISYMYFNNKNFLRDIDYFNVIKDDILNYKTLSKEQIEYIKNLNSEDKFELIQIYNKLIDATIQNLNP